MARMTHGWAAAAVVLATAMLCTACSPSSGKPDDDQASQVVAAVTAADPRVVDASAETSTSGFSSGWVVDVVLSGTEAVSSDELSALLLAARHAGDRDPGHIHLFATNQDGGSFDLTAAAQALDMPYTNVGAGLGVTSDEIDDALGAAQ